jgi:hypothetical protein
MRGWSSLDSGFDGEVIARSYGSMGGGARLWDHFKHTVTLDECIRVGVGVGVGVGTSKTRPANSKTLFVVNLPLHHRREKTAKNQKINLSPFRKNRSVPLSVPLSLQLARHASPPHSRNLLARDESYAAFLQQTVLPTRETMHEHGLKGFHELRAAYACERYEQLTGHAAPVNGGHCYRIDRDLDQQARKQISLELGDNRIDVVSAYIGGRA